MNAIPMPPVRFKIDAHQLRLVNHVVDGFLKEAHTGELGNMLASVLEGVALRLRRKEAERRLEHQLILPVHQALAVRRMVLAGIELYPEGSDRNAMRSLISTIDPATARYTTV